VLNSTSPDDFTALGVERDAGRRQRGSVFIQRNQFLAGSLLATSNALGVQMAHGVLLSQRRVIMQLLVLSATLVGSLGAAWAIHRAMLELCLKAIDRGRR